jgi:hypothetical protein
MARIVMVHGAFNELWGPHELKARWLPALRDGLWHHDITVDEKDVAACFYGDLFRNDPETVNQQAWQKSRAGTAAEMLSNLSGGSGGLEAIGQAVNQATWERTVDMVTILSTNAEVASEAHRRLRTLIDSDTRIIVAHSLGTILSYNLLCANPELTVDTLVTLGSPLGNSKVAVMLPAKGDDGLWPWPGTTKHWVNVAALGDKVTGDGCLNAQFGPRVQNHRVDNGHRHHDPEPYLNAAVTGAAVAAALA